MKFVLVLFSVFLLYSCKRDKKFTNISGDCIIEKDSSFTTIEEDRISYSINYKLNLDKIKTYKLTIENQDSIIYYHYKSLSDSIYNLSVNFNKIKKKLYFYSDSFSLLTLKYKYSNQKISNNKFDFYWQNTGQSHQTRPILFNSKYGILGIYNDYGSEFLFFKEKIEDVDLVKEIILSMEQYNPTK